jgi:hypothetical protein
MKYSNSITLLVGIIAVLFIASPEKCSAQNYLTPQQQAQWQAQQRAAQQQAQWQAQQRAAQQQAQWEAQQRAAQQQAQWQAQQQAAQQQAQWQAQQQAAQQQAQWQAQQRAAQQQAQRQAQLEAQQQAAQQRAMEEEQRREAAQQRAIVEQQRREEAAQQRAIVEQQRREEAQQRAIVEQQKREEAARQRAVVEAQRKAQLEAKKQQQEQAKLLEATRRAEQDAQRKAQLEAKRQAQEQAKQLEAQRRAEQDAQRKAQLEEKKQQQEQAKQQANSQKQLGQQKHMNDREIRHDDRISPKISTVIKTDDIVKNEISEKPMVGSTSNPIVGSTGSITQANTKLDYSPTFMQFNNNNGLQMIQSGQNQPYSQFDLYYNGLDQMGMPQIAMDPELDPNYDELYPMDADGSEMVQPDQDQVDSGSIPMDGSQITQAGQYQEDSESLSMDTQTIILPIRILGEESVLNVLTYYPDDESAILRISHINITASGDSVQVDFNYQIYNNLYPSEIDQIFVTVGKKVMACIYNDVVGGYPGKSDYATCTFIVDSPCINQSIYITRVPAKNIDEGLSAYNNGSDKGLWVADISQ